MSSEPSNPDVSESLRNLRERYWQEARTPEADTPNALALGLYRNTSPSRWHILDKDGLLCGQHLKLGETRSLQEGRDRRFPWCKTCRTAVETLTERFDSFNDEPGTEAPPTPPIHVVERRGREIFGP